MPYKDPIKAAESARRRYLLNIEKRKLCGKKFYEANKEKVLAQHKAKAEVLKEECKKWRKENKEKVKKYKVKTKDKRKTQQKKDKKKSIDQLKDIYVVSQLKLRTGISQNVIRQHPELIENYRSQLKLKRLLKTKKK